jgi:hypothetical protein
MKYQQIQLARLAGAGRKLVADGCWHAFENVERTFYRVVGRRMQRVKFESDESPGLLKLFDALPPLPPKLLREGFRNEITFRLDDDAYCIDDILTRSFSGWEQVAASASARGCTATALRGNALAWRVRFEFWDEVGIHNALIVARALTSALAQCANLPALESRDAASILEGEMRALAETLQAAGEHQ